MCFLDPDLWLRNNVCYGSQSDYSKTKKNPLSQPRIHTRAKNSDEPSDKRTMARATRNLLIINAFIYSRFAIEKNIFPIKVRIQYEIEKQKNNRKSKFS